MPSCYFLQEYSKSILQTSDHQTETNMIRLGVIYKEF